MRANTLQTPSPVTPGFLGTKSASLRGQKSQSNMKPASPPGRPLTRKASLSSLEVSPQHGFQPTVQLTGPSPPHPVQRYEAPTTSSRAKSHTSSSTSRMRVSEFGMQTPTSSTAGPSQRLTLPASISRQKSRPAVSGLFSNANLGRSSSPLPRPPSSTSHASSSKSMSQSRSTPPLTSSGSAPRFLRKPKKSKAYGDGTELDAFDDLPTDRDKESHFRVQAKSRPASQVAQPPRSPPRIKTIPKRMDDTAPGLRRAGRIEVTRKPSVSDLAVKKKTKTGSPRHKEQKRKPTLIRNLGGVGGPKVVGEMKWNPHTLRWEGNDQVLREFEAASARPALITHLTGSSIGSPVASMNGGRQVGHMIFDPSKMCWISTLDPDEDEPDVFADLADDEEDEFAPRSAASEASTGRSRLTSPSPHSRAGSESADEGLPFERGSRASLCVADVDDRFREECRKAEVRHRAEMVGWTIPSPPNRHHEQERGRGYLYEIRALATRQY